MKNTQEIKQKNPNPNGKKRDRNKKGQFIEGNPGGGRPQDSFSLITILKRQLQQIPKELKGKERKQYAELLVKRVLADAIKKGDDQKIKLIFNYVEGMPKQEIDQNFNITEVEKASHQVQDLIKRVKNDK